MFINYSSAKKLLAFVGIPSVIKGVIGTLLACYKDKYLGKPPWSTQKLIETMLFNVVFTLGFDGLGVKMESMKKFNQGRMSSHFNGEYGRAKKRLLDLINGIKSGNMHIKKERWDKAVELALKLQNMDKVFRVLTESSFGDLVLGLSENYLKLLSPVQPAGD